jgi:hypothetical protein
MRAYWVAMAISAGFTVLINGCLTKQSAPIPSEDFAFGFALLTVVLICWIKVTGVRAPELRSLEDRIPAVDEVDLAGVPTR